MEKIKINIVGGVASGKSTVTRLIMDQLIKNGLNVEIVDQDDDSMNFYDEKRQTLADKYNDLKIEVQTFNINKDAKANP